jgi:hypothetical protein
MATPNSETKDNLSKQRGKHASTAARTFLRIMQIEEYNKHRNDNFDASYKRYEEEISQKFADLTESRKKGLMESFTRSYYKPEFNLVAEYQAKQEQWLSFKEKEPLSVSEKQEFSQLSAVMEMNEYEYVGSRILDNDVFEQIKSSMSPADVKSLNKTINDPIKEIQNNLDDTMMPNGVQRRHAATIEYFSSSKPDLKTQLDELKSKAKSDGEMEPLMQASAILRAGITMANPSGWLVSKGISVLMGTKAMQPFTAGVKKSVDNMVAKSGLKASLKKHMGKLSPRAQKMVAGGLAVAALGTLTALGVIDPTNAIDQGLAFVDYVSGPEVIDGFANSDPLSLDAEMEMEPGVDKPNVDTTNADLGSPDQPDAGGVDKPNVDTTNADLSSPDQPDAGGVDKPDGPQKDVDSSAPSKPDADEISVNDVVLESDKPDATSDDSASKPELGSTETHIVRYGDTLSEIVASRLEEAGIPYDYSLIDKYVDDIVAMNENITDPDVIRKGMTIDVMSFPTPEPALSTSALQNAQGAITSMPDVCTPEVTQELKNAGLYPTSDPLSPTLNAYAQHASLNSEVPELKYSPECVIDEPKKEDESVKLYRI